MMKTKTNRLFAAEDDGCRNAESGKYRFVILDPRPKLVAPFSGRFYQCQGTGDWAKLFARTAGDTAWISTNAKKTDALLRAATAYLSSHTGRRTLGDLMLLSSPRPESLPALHAVFRNVVGEVASYRFLPPEELVDVLSSPREEARDLLIGGMVDQESETLTLTRGDLTNVVLPLSLIRPSGRAAPDPSDFAVEDYGHTVRLGQYEAAADAILYEIDSDFRRRLKARHRQEDCGFGPSLRRLRIQRGLSRNDFGKLSAKTIARIERGETAKPHGETMTVIAQRLGVMEEEIESY